MNTTSFITFGGGEGDRCLSPSPGDLELLHNDPHGCVGGLMASMYSPIDPVFFWHHSLIDMLWQEWEDMPNRTSLGEMGGSLANYDHDLRYDYHPDDLVDSRDLNIWYAKNGIVNLNNYNTDSTNVYSYTGVIEAEDFIVTSNSDVTLTAGSKIVLKPGFKTELGGTFHAFIDNQVGNISSKLDEEKPLVEKLEDINIQEGPLTWSLSQNYPNPFNPVTTIDFALPEEAHNRLEVYNIIGQKVVTLVDEVRNAGYHSVRFDGANLTSGMYIYRIVSNNFIQSKQMLLLK